MNNHPVFVLSCEEEKDYIVAFVPSLGKAFLIPSEQRAQIPEYIEASDEGGDLSIHSGSPSFTRATLVLTQGCNLRCVYCYEDAECVSSDDMNGPEVGVMPAEIVEATVDHILDSAASLNDGSGASLHFFGGEPTLAWRRLIDSIKYARIKADESNIPLRLSISTNGVLSPQRLSKLIGSVENFTVSIDGPPDIHDSARPTVGGKGSFYAAFRTAKSIHDAGFEKLLLRTTVSRDSLMAMPRIAKFFSDHFPGSTQAYEPIQDTGRASLTGVSGPTMRDFLSQVLQIMPVVEDSGGRVKISMLDMDNSADAFCGVSGTNLIVTPEGIVTSCNRKMSKDDFRGDEFIFGNHNTSARTLVFDKFAWMKLARYSSTSIPECMDCFLRHACRGGCPAIKADGTEEFWTAPVSYCDDLKAFATRLLFRRLKK